MNRATDGFVRTYRGIFGGPDGERPSIKSIEIPIIQRDYAQGREDDDTAMIRRDFLEVLINALTTPESVGLDFVYGEVTAHGVLKPLDGQQRLTTLFLLHWYVASRAGVLDPNEPWTKFRYATRLSAEYFCHELATNDWPHEESDPQTWITDQAWYLFPWRTDPTIQSMLVMITAIHERLSREEHDFVALWERLSSPDAEAISFLFLPIDDMESGDDLYIKMNSRGKPLTEFEVFKARFEKLLGASGRQAELSEKFDREWSDLLWHYEGGNFLVDDEFMNYLAFIVDVCEWRAGATRGQEPLLDRARRVFVEHEDADTHLGFLFFAFDTWVGETASDDVPAAVFAKLFSVGGDSDSGLLLFESQNPNLFGACLESYGTKQFSLAETILLYAVIIFRHLCPDEPEGVLRNRLRSLRNLAESAPNQVQGPFMPDLIESTTTLMTTGSLDGLKRFSQAWLEDEKLKRSRLEEHPSIEAAVHSLEDHPLLRGRLFAFDLDPLTIEDHADAFWKVSGHDALEHLPAALLAQGDYSREMASTKRQFGVSGQRQGGGSWRDVLTLGSRESTARMREAVTTLLNDVIGRAGDPGEVLEDIRAEWLAHRETARHFDWQYYFVRYPSMLSAPQGIYVGEYDPAGAGYRYQVDMMNGGDYRSAFKDPYLLAIWNEVNQPERLAMPEFRSWDYTGTEKAMKFIESGTGIRTVDAGFEVLLPEDSAQADTARTVLTQFVIDAANFIPVKRTGPDNLDAEDSVQVGVAIVKALLNAGL